jgi:tetratricopeptide (TPR) repeat protein
LFQGDVAGVLGDTRLGLESYEMTRHRHLGPTFGDHDPGTCGHVARAIALQMSGDQDQAKDILSKGIALAEALDHPNSLAQALQMGAISRQFAGDRESTYALARRVAALAEKYGLSRWSLGSLLLMAWAGAVGSGVADAARLIDAEIDKATAAVPETPYLLGLAGEVLLAAARPADGLAHLDRAIAAVEEPDVGLYLPEVYRLRGECLLAIDHANKDDARRVFSTARDIARRRGAVIFERRAEASLLKYRET